jgi:hypothetical protein
MLNPPTCASNLTGGDVIQLQSHGRIEIGETKHEYARRRINENKKVKLPNVITQLFLLAKSGVYDSGSENHIHGVPKHPWRDLHYFAPTRGKGQQRIPQCKNTRGAFPNPVQRARFRFREADSGF